MHHLAKITCVLLFWTFLCLLFIFCFDRYAIVLHSAATCLPYSFRLVLRPFICFPPVLPLALCLFSACCSSVLRSLTHLSPLLFCALRALYFIYFSFALHSSLVRFAFARRICPQLVPHLFSTCSTFTHHLFFPFVHRTFSVYFLFVFSSSLPLPLAPQICSASFCEAECSAPGQGSPPRVTCACVSWNRFSARNFPEVRMDVKAKRKVSRKDSRVRLGSEVRRA